MTSEHHTTPDPATHDLHPQPADSQQASPPADGTTRPAPYTAPNGHAAEPPTVPYYTHPFDPDDPTLTAVPADDPEASVDGEPPEGVPGGTTLEDEPQPVRKHTSTGTIIKEVLETVILAALIFLAVRAIVQNFKVEGSSMYSSFYDGEYMLVNKAVYSRIDLGLVHKVLPFIDPGSNPKHYIFHGPQRGDVIVFAPPPASGQSNKDFIKRVIGVPGDTIDFRDNHVLVNGQEVVEPYITARTDCQGQYCHVVLQKDQYFAMGDNRTNSSDSRFWGPVQADKIVGKALLSYWCGGSQCKGSFDKVGLSPNHSPVLTPAGAKP